MRAATVLVVGALLSGCLSSPGSDPATRPDWLGPGVYRVTADGMDLLDGHAAVSSTHADGSPGLHIDFLQLVEPDRMAVVIVEFLGTATGEVRLHSDVVPPSLQNEQGMNRDYCETGSYVFGDEG